MSRLLLFNSACSLYMTGIIWFVQVVHYPLFERVGTPNFAIYANEHANRTTLIVAPAMLLELATSILLLIQRPPGVPAVMLWVLAAMNIGVFASTFFVQVPLHNELQKGFHAEAIRTLAASNWVRTLLWTLRSTGLCWALLQGR
jgi:Na+/H+ antiporter NhaC